MLSSQVWSTRYSKASSCQFLRDFSLYIVYVDTIIAKCLGKTFEVGDLLKKDIQSYHTCSNRLILKAQEKALRSTNNHPKRVALAADIPKFLQLSSQGQRPFYYFVSWTWGSPNQQPLSFSTMAVKHPSQITGFHFCFWYHLLGLKRWCSLTLIESYQAVYTIYTDGSASGGTRIGAQQHLSLQDPQSSLKW